MNTVPAKHVAAEYVTAVELECLDAVAARMDSDSQLGSALLTIVASVRNGNDVVLGTKTSTLTPAEAATLLGISRTHLYKILDAGELPFVRVGRDRRLELEHVLRFRSARQEGRRKLAERFAHAGAARASIVADRAAVDQEQARRLGF